MITLLILAIAVFAFFIARRKVIRRAQESESRPHSLGHYYGFYAAIWVLVPSLLVLLALTSLQNPVLDGVANSAIQNAFPQLPESFRALKAVQAINIANGLLQSSDAQMLQIAGEYNNAKTQLMNLRIVGVLLIALAGFSYGFVRVRPQLKARVAFEQFIKRCFFIASVIAVLTTIGIIASLLFEALRFFWAYPPWDFFFGLHWSPNAGFVGAGDTTGGEALGSFGMVPVFMGTMLVAVIAMLVAVPVGLFAAIYMAEFASSRIRNIVKPTLEILAGIPTVVYGFFAALTAAPFFRSVGLSLNMDVSSQSALAAGSVMGVMIIPFISSLSDDVITAVPQSLRDGAYGLGSTKGEVITKVVLPAALPGLVGAFLLGISRAIGETMIVVMAAGVAANLTFNPLESVTTVTVQIVLLLTGDTVFDSPKTLSAFALGITLFFATLLLNIGALGVARRLGEKYD